MLHPLRHAARRLGRAPGFSAATILTLAVGLATATTVFSAVNAVLLRPLPYAGSDRLVSPSHTLVVGATLRVEQSDATLLFYQRHNRAFSAFGGYRTTAAAVGPSGSADAERIPAALVSAGVFQALAVAPLRGRLSTALDELPSAPPVALVSERLWKRKYGGDPALVGRAVDIDGVAREVIAILPAAVRFPASDTELWLPLRLDPAKTDSATFEYQAVARLRDGVSIDAAAADLEALLPRLPDEFPGRMTRQSIRQTEMHPSVRRLDAVIAGDSARMLWLVLGASAFLLAIACANVTNLFLVRGEQRRATFAVQRALGAARTVIFADFLSEAALVALAGGALGVLGATAGAAGLRLLGSAMDLPRASEIGIDTTVVIVAALATVAAALGVSGLSAAGSGAASSSLPMRHERAATASRTRHRVRQALVVSQVALALILVAGSGLMARSMWRLRAVPPGFAPSQAIGFRLALPAAGYASEDAAVRFFVRAEDRLAAIPGVRAAGVSSKLPLDELGRTDTAVFVEGRPLAPGTLPGIHPVSYVTPGYFAAAGIPLMAGRTFARPDPPTVVLETVVSRAFADRYWKTESPLGKRIRILITGPLYTIVGVAGDVRDTALDRPADQILYCPLLPAREDRRWTPRDLAFVVRTAGDPAMVTGAVRDAIRGLDRSLPLYRIRTLDETVAQSSARRSFTLMLVAAASAIALMLGAIGLYGVLSYVVTLRAREMGIRVALGAPPAAVGWMVSRQALAVAAVGVAVGLAGAVVLTRLLSALLFEVSPTDPAVLTLAAVSLLAVAAAASSLPARRAAAVDPAITLRAE